MRIAVAGGTGVVGRHVVRALDDAGHQAVVLTRSRGVDVTTGAGLDAALAGADAVIDVTNVVTTSKKASVGFFEAATRRLLDSGQRAGLRHHVALSIVGCDRVDFGYYFGKRRQEELVLTGAVPASVLRATQFFEFAEQFVAPSRMPVAVVPRMRTQPVAAREVAAALVALAAGPAVGRAPELAGPQEEHMVDMVRRLKRRRGGRRLVLPLTVPGQVGRAMRGGALLPTGSGPRGRQDFTDWLRDTDAASPSPGLASS
jgi:uncharacterized protein YbjT (DUF2867 family)